jgi:DNA repair protein RecO (recombination protein O)
VRRVRVYRVSSVVIRQRDLGEADRILVLYTRQRGKLSAVAKGIKRPGSRLAGGLQLFSHARVQLAAGRSLEVVTQVQPLAAFYHLREDMQRYIHASYAAEFLDAVTDEGAPDGALFDTILSTLDELDTGGHPPTLVRAFELKLLARLGYGPELDVCVSCGANPAAGEAGFSVSQGGVVCTKCLRAAGAPALSGGALQAMRDLRRLPARELAGRRLSAAAGQEVERHMCSFVEYHVDKRLYSAEYLAR